ncbi:MAG: LPS assembly lipoprotein LptE [Hydrogenophaga sp.]
MNAIARLDSLPRRQALRLVAAGLAATGLAGCGFALRKAPTFVFQSIRLQGNEGTAVARELREALQANGLQVLTSATSVPTQVAQVVLTVVTDQRERVVVGQTAAGQVRELQLRTRFVFRLRTASEKDLIQDTELLLERDISFTETAVLSKESEEAMLYRDMQGDIVQQVVRRLAAVKSL